MFNVTVEDIRIRMNEKYEYELGKGANAIVVTYFVLKKCPGLREPV